MDMDNQATYSKFFKPALEFAISPFAERHVHADAMGIKIRQNSRGRIVTTLRGYLQDPNLRCRYAVATR